MAKKPTVPIKVVAELEDGRINSADGIIMLDAILYHAWFWAHAPHVLEGRGGDSVPSAAKSIYMCRMFLTTSHTEKLTM